LYKLQTQKGGEKDMNKIKSLGIGIGTYIVTAHAETVSAQAEAKAPRVPNPVSGRDLGSVLGDVINALLLFAGAVAVLFLIIGGFRYVISSGNPEQVEGAKKTILYAILGLIVIFIAFVLVRLIQQYLGVRGDFNVQSGGGR
jgi:amino acid transporter